MDVLVPITMKNAARMRYAMWIAELRIIWSLNANGAEVAQHTCFSVPNQIQTKCERKFFHQMNAPSSSHISMWAIAEETVLFAPEIK